MKFAQLRNRLTTHFSERIPVDKRRISVYKLTVLYISNVGGYTVYSTVNICICTGWFSFS